MRISDWSSDVCSSDLSDPARLLARVAAADGVLIEHDVPSGGQDSGRIASALRAFDQDGRVVYAGGLAPAVSYGEPPGMLVAPAALIERARELRALRGTTPQIGRAHV